MKLVNLCQSDGAWSSALVGFAEGGAATTGGCTMGAARVTVGVTVGVSNHVWGEHATEFLATGTAIRRLGEEHRLPKTSPKPTFTLGLDS